MCCLTFVIFRVKTFKANQYCVFCPTNIKYTLFLNLPRIVCNK